MPDATGPELAASTPLTSSAAEVAQAIAAWLSRWTARDWVDNRDLTRKQLRDLLVAAFAAALLAAEQADPKVRLDVA